MARRGERRAGRAGGAQCRPFLAAQRFSQAPGHGDRAHRAEYRPGQPGCENSEPDGGGMDRGTTEGALLIELGGRLIEYRFARRRRRTLGITIDATGLKVAAPLRAPWRDIEAFLRDKERWILAKLDEWARVPRAPVLQCVSGEALPLCGALTLLEVRPGRPRGP